MTTPDPDDPISLAALSARLIPARARLEAFVEGIPAERWEQPLGSDGWTLKDHVAHMAAWEAGIAALLARGSRALGMGLTEEQWAAAPGADAANAAIYERWREVPLGEVLSAFRAAHATLLAMLAKMSDGDLLRPYRDYDADWESDAAGRPVVGWIAGNTFGHWDEHLRWLEAALRP